MRRRLASLWRTRSVWLPATATAAALLAVLAGTAHPAPADADHPSAATSPVVGAWVGQVHGAQYEDHLYTFHADGTMAGTNPQRVQEKPDGSGVNDSLAMGTWHMEHGRVVGVFLELNASQTTHLPSATLKVVFSLVARGDTLTGSAHVFVGTQQVPDATFELHRIVA